MLAFIIAIPAFVLLFSILASMLSSDEFSDKVIDIMGLETKVVKIFNILVMFSVLVWVVTLLVPLLLPLLHTIDLGVNVLGIVWFLQCLSNGKVRLWYETLKAKCTLK